MGEIEGWWEIFWRYTGQVFFGILKNIPKEANSNISNVYRTIIFETFHVIISKVWKSGGARSARGK